MNLNRNTDMMSMSQLAGQSSEVSTPLIATELEEMGNDLGDLHRSINELIARLDPVLQPDLKAKAEQSVAGAMTPRALAPASPVRQSILNRREQIRNIQSDLAGWRFRIEI